MSERLQPVTGFVTRHKRKIAGGVAGLLAVGALGFGVTRGGETTRADQAPVKPCGNTFANPYEQGYIDRVNLPTTPSAVVAITAKSLKAIHQYGQEHGELAFDVVRGGQRLFHARVETTPESVVIEEPDRTSLLDDLGLVTDKVEFPLGTKEGDEPDIAVGAVMCLSGDSKLYPNGTALAITAATDMIRMTSN